MYFRLIVGITLIWTSLCSLQAQVITYVHDASCSVITQDTMTYEVRNIETPVGRLLLHHYELKQKIKDYPIRYTLQYCDYPEGTIHHDSIELLVEFFEATAEASAKAVMGKVDYLQQQGTYGYPGMVWRITFDNGKGMIKSRGFVRNNRYFNLKVEYHRLISIYNLEDKFFDSFRFEDTASH